MSLEISVNDLGNSQVKTLKKDKRRLIFNNIILSDISNSMGRRVYNEIAAEGIKFDLNNFLDYLDVTVRKDENEEERFFVGNLAVAKDPENAERRDLYIPKAKAQHSFVMNAISNALNAIDLKEIEKLRKQKNIDVGDIVSVALLPTREMKDEELVDYMYDQNVGSFEVTFNLGLLEGITVKYNVPEGLFFVLPEATIGLAGMYYDDEGFPKEEFINKTKDKYIFGIDIGGHSSDAGCYLNENPVPEYCFDIGVGLLTSIDEILEELKEEVKEEYGINVNPTKEEITEDIMNSNFRFEYVPGSYIDTTKIVKGAFNRKIKPLVSNFNNKIKNNIDHKIYGIWSFGGGSILTSNTMKSRLETRFGDKIHIVDEDLIDATHDPVWFNAEGTLRYIKNTLRINGVEF